ncbi:MAG: hypothetical protein GX638_01230, partial [Crenarchaeota archaeon]|nr:hypothetical protein [Thermoproteota archaeon]
MNYLFEWPKSIWQLHNCENFFRYQQVFESHFGHLLYIFYDDTLKKYKIEDVIFGEGFKIFIFDDFYEETIKQITETFANIILTSPNSNCIKLLQENFPHKKDRIASNTNELLSILKALRKLFLREQKINLHFTELDNNQTSQINLEDKYHFEFPDFRPAIINAYTLNQITAYFWDNEYKLYNVHPPTSRFDYLLKQCKTIDMFHYELYKEGSLKRLHFQCSILPPIILTFPILNQTIFWALKDTNNFTLNDFQPKDMKDILIIEQDQNYQHKFPLNTDSENDFTDKVKKYISVENYNLKFLDGISYLNTSFTSSPVVRFPLKTNIFNPFLSAFSPDRGTAPNK